MTDFKEIISDLKKKVINLKEDKSELIEELERKENLIHSLKTSFPENAHMDAISTTNPLRKLSLLAKNIGRSC